MVMNEKCGFCDVSFEPEPGFYQGAMFVGYGFAVAGIIAVSILLYFSGNRSEWTYIGAVSLFTILMTPLNYRYSRIFYLHFFGGIRFNPR